MSSPRAGPERSGSNTGTCLGKDMPRWRDSLLVSRLFRATGRRFHSRPFSLSGTTRRVHVRSARGNPLGAEQLRPLRPRLARAPAVTLTLPWPHDGEGTALGDQLPEPAEIVEKVASPYRQVCAGGRIEQQALDVVEIGEHDLD